MWPKEVTIIRLTKLRRSGVTRHHDAEARGAPRGVIHKTAFAAVLPASPALSLCYKDMNLVIANCRGRALRACLAQLHAECLIHLQQLRCSNTLAVLC